ncbi:MAG: isopropylmalate isomerase [Yoonia sp.]
MTLEELTACIKTSWSAQIGDPTVIGWFTVIAYVLAGLLALLVVKKQSGRLRLFWSVLSVLLFALSINKQLDLQSALTAAGRCLALAQGWYEDRASVQSVFIAFVAATGSIFSVGLAVIMQRTLAQNWLVLVGLGFLCTFMIIRAAGFHHFDRFIDYEIANVRTNWIMELGGIGMIAANAGLLLGHRSTTH